MAESGWEATPGMNKIRNETAARNHTAAGTGTESDVGHDVVKGSGCGNMF